MASSSPRRTPPRRNPEDLPALGRNPVKIAARVMAFCFSASATTSPRDVGDFPKAYSFPSASSNSSVGSERKLSARSIYGSKGSTQMQPGGMRFTMPEILKATKNFSASNKIGQGTFGSVYKGKLADGTVIAIKRANKDDKDVTIPFQNEISTLEQIEHLNLVKFMGYLEHKDEQLIVLEYVPNGTVREHLDCKRGNPLDFASRLDIAIDVAHAIAYLHMYTDHPVIHRDIKSSNILLTDNLRAKVADFGLSRLGAEDNTHVVTEVKGTVGYLDPEYLTTSQLTVKSDVYAFGMLLVELMSGRYPIEFKKPRQEQETAKWARKRFEDGNSTEILDPNVPQTPATNIALDKVLKLAFHCLEHTGKSRPSMTTCAKVLWCIRRDYKAALSSENHV